MALIRRWKSVREQLKAQRLEAALFTDLSNVFYLTNFRGTDGAAFFTLDEVILIVDGRYATQARETSAATRVIEANKIDGIAECLKSTKVKSVGFEDKSVSYGFHQRLIKIDAKVKWSALGSWVTSFRAQKDSDELSLMRKANRIADAAIHAVLPHVRTGRAERDLAAELEFQMKKRGAEKASFPILIASGPRSALPHGAPSARKLKKGDFVFFDFGSTYDGYQSDQTITLCVGKPDSELRKVYDIVKEAHDRAVEALEPGKKAAQIDQIAREVIENAGYGKAFSHSLGHGIGVEVHEYPMLGPRSEATIEEGMVVTIEPGIYLPEKGGVRIEDAYIVQKTGPERLTGITKSFRIV